VPGDVGAPRDGGPREVDALLAVADLLEDGLGRVEALARLLHHNLDTHTHFYTQRV